MAITASKLVKPIELVTYKEAEKMLIERALIYSNGVQDRASKLLGVCTRTVRDRIKKYDIKVDLTKLVELKDITTIEEMERDLLVKTLEFTRGNKQGSARLLGISRRGLEYKMNRLDIDAKCYLK